MSLTTANRINLRRVIESGDATEMANYLISRLIDERDENSAHDHWHPEIANPLGEMARAWMKALSDAGITYEYRSA